jgi:hypothetical protein
VPSEPAGDRNGSANLVVYQTQVTSCREKRVLTVATGRSHVLPERPGTWPGQVPGVCAPLLLDIRPPSGKPENAFSGSGFPGRQWRSRNRPRCVAGIARVCASRRRHVSACLFLQLPRQFEVFDSSSRQT